MQVSGNVLRARYNYVRSLGPDALTKLIPHLDPETRAIIEAGVLETQWYPLSSVIDLSSKADDVLGQGDRELCYQMGRYSCDTNLTGIYRIFFRFGNINFLVKRAAKAWHSQYDCGEMKVLADEPNHVHLRLEDFPVPSHALCSVIRGWMVRAGELSGSEVESIHENCRDLGDEHCEWRFDLL